MSARQSGGDYELLNQGLTKLPEVLAFLDIPELRKGQREPIYYLLSGVDTIVVLPTGLGKSLVYTVPTLCHGWRTVLFSPLVALMQDQVQGLWKKGVKAAQLTGMQSAGENDLAIQDWIAGDVQMLFTAPERLDNPAFLEAMTQQPPDFVVIDEGHVCSQWSDNFRHHYVKIGDFIDQTNPRVVMACTATAPSEVVRDIRRVYRMEDATLWKYLPRRTNLNLSSRPFYGYQDLADQLRKIDGSCIVYCATVKEVVETTANLQSLLPSEVITLFHGQLKDTEKSANMKLFLDDRARIVVCTNAFGMGIDKGSIKAVIHRNYPGSPEALSQEIGRAGRNGEQAYGITMYDDDSRNVQEYFFEMANPSESLIRKVYQTLADESQNGTRPVKLTLAQIAGRCGTTANHVTSVIETLSGVGCISRENNSEKVAKIRIRKESDHPAFIRASDLIRKAGHPDGQGFIQVNLQWLADEMDRTVQTVTNYLRNWDRENVIEYQPPYRGAVTQVVGPLTLVDFDRLKDKAGREREKLSKMTDYLNTPDDQKHEWLEAYFEVENTEA